jgi:uncharacterized membrane protein
MKKIITILLALVFCFAFGMTAHAGDDGEEKIDASQPRLMVTEYSMDTKSLKPGKESELKVTLKNYSKTKALHNMKLSINDESGDIKPIGTGTQYVEKIYAGSSYTWTVKLTAAKTAQIGEHAVTVSSEYEDKYYTAYSGSDVLRLNVKQTVGLDYSGLQLPSKVVEGDTITLDMSFMNTGKCKIRNIKIDFDIPNLESGGTTFVGEIEAGESGAGSANLRAGNTLGETKGTITVTYEDEFGETYEKKAEVSTVVEKKAPEKTEEDERNEKKNPQWWAFLLSGTVLGGGIGCVIPLTIQSRKQRKEDELRL